MSNRKSIKKIFSNKFTLNIANDKIQDNYEKDVSSKKLLFLIYWNFQKKSAE